MHNQRLLRRMLDEGHQVTNHGYRHVLFGEKPFVYGKRDHFHGLGPGGVRPDPSAHPAEGDLRL